ncbi:MAG: serine/threonine protein kinase [Deltaproteobacteria bacterium]|nr:serine/threonine protein kinase [Deltaproteobacteria bacterium]
MIGQVVDGHEIIRPLGAGGMGQVYLARDNSGALRAFKVVRADKTDAKTLARFRREVHALGKLRHPGIVQILDAGTLPDGQLYLGMEYVAGPDLQAAIGWDGPLAVADAMRVLLQLANALAYAHAAGVVHRDLKPGNVILEDGDPGKAKIIDFGLAKVAAEEGLTRLTEDQQALGSPLYWAPEQSSNREVGPAVDVYALGGVAYFALSGVPLFKPAPPVALVYAHANEMPEPLAARCRGVSLPDGLAELIAACVMKSPASRPAASEIAGELDRMLVDMPTFDGSRRVQRLFTTTSASDFAQALQAQIRQVLLDLAATIDHPVDDVERINGELSDLELDLAVLEADGDPRLAAVQAQVAQLKGAMGDAYRDLHEALAARRAASPPEAAGLYEELDSLLEQYRSL